MRTSSNPVFSSLSTDSARGATHLGGAGRGAFQQGQYGQQGFGGQAGFGAPQAHPQFATDTRPMTIDDVVAKTGTTLGLLSIVGAVAFYLITMNPGLLFPFILVGGIGGFITVLVATFGRKMDSAPVTLVYGALEGLFVGAATYLFTIDLQGTGGVLGAVGAAILGTIGVFVGMLFVYKTGAIRVTPKFTRFMSAAIVGVLFAAIGSIVLSLFTGSNPLYNGGPIAIGFCLLCIGLAAFSFLMDFDNADRLVRAGAPSKMAWGVALGLTVTLVWLYIEILRLMSYFRD